MTEFDVYANGVFWGRWEAETAEEAIQIAADEVGTVDVGQERACTDGMTAHKAPERPMTDAIEKARAEGKPITSGMINAARYVLVTLAERLTDRAYDPESSVPRDAPEVLWSAAAIVKIFGPVVALEMEADQ